MERKYEFTDETKQILGRTLHRIIAVQDFGNVKAGDKGGWIESEENLSQEDTCWVRDHAMVLGNTQVCENARVYENAQVSGEARVSGNARVYGSAEVCGTADVGTDGDYIVFKNWWSSGRYFTWTRSNNLWKVGCFHGTGEELIRKAYEDSELSGREYERIVRYVEEILKAEEE